MTTSMSERSEISVSRNGVVRHTVRIAGHAAIEAAERLGVQPSKYADPTEDARVLTIPEARDVAREDDGLVYLDVEVRLDREEQRNVEATGTDVSADVRRVAAAPSEAATLLAECLEGTEDSDALAAEWRSYVEAVCSAVGVDLPDDEAT